MSLLCFKALWELLRFCTGLYKYNLLDFFVYDIIVSILYETHASTKVSIWVVSCVRDADARGLGVTNR